jgi:L-ascorbate metabolism protein UlaG (beta-lactamase superfamily)
VLLSHNHYDHLDLPSLRAIVARDDPAFVVPLGTGRTLAKVGTRRITELDWWESHDVGGLSITATPARHFSARTPFDRNRALWSGFLLSGGPMPVLFAGDSGDGPHWRQIRDRLGAPGLALLPIGAYAPRFLMGAIHMTPEEAVAAHLALRAERSIGMHFGTFQLTDEQIDEPVRRLAEAVRQAGLDPGAFITLGSGDVHTVRRGTRRRAPGSPADVASTRAPTHQESR